MPHANSIELNLPQMQCLEAFVLLSNRRPALSTIGFFFPCTTMGNPTNQMHGHITCPKKRTCGTTHSRSGPTPESTLRRYLTPCVSTADRRCSCISRSNRDSSPSHTVRAPGVICRTSRSRRRSDLRPLLIVLCLPPTDHRPRDSHEENANNQPAAG